MEISEDKQRIVKPYVFSFCDTGCSSLWHRSLRRNHFIYRAYGSNKKKVHWKIQLSTFEIKILERFLTGKK